MILENFKITLKDAEDGRDTMWLSPVLHLKRPAIKGNKYRQGWGEVQRPHCYTVFKPSKSRELQKQIYL